MGLFGPPNIEKLKAKNNIEGLIKALDYKKDDNVQREAIEALGKIGDTRAINSLIKRAQDEDIGKYAIKALEEIAQVCSKILIATETNCNNNRCEETVILLGKIGEPAVESVINVFSHRYHGSLIYAHKAIKEIGEPAIKTLIDAVVDKKRDIWIRAESAEALGEIGGKRGIEPLIQSLKDENIWVRCSAAEALGRIKDNIAIEPLIHALEDKDSGVREKAAKALEKIGQPAVAPFIESCKNRNYIFKEAILLLRILGTGVDVEQIIERTIEPLIHALVDKASPNRKDTVEALGEIRNKRAVEPLILALEDEDWRVQNVAVEALGRIGDTKAIKPLMKLFFNPKMISEQQIIASAIGQIKDKGAVEDLIKALKNPSLRESAAFALGQIGDMRAVQPLEDVLKNPLMGYDPYALADDVKGRMIDEERVCKAVREALENIKKQRTGN